MYTLFCLLIFAPVAASVCEGERGVCEGERGNALIQMATPAVKQVVVESSTDEETAQEHPPAPAPLVHSPAPAPVSGPAGLTQSAATGTVNVVSYNLYEWNVGQNNRWGNIYSKIRSHSFDLIGFQECSNVASVLRNVGLGGWQYYQGPGKPDSNPAPLAWNPSKFSKLGGPGNKWVASDKYGGRYMTWVRLQHRATGAKILFANTHGPLGNCGSTLGNNWKAGVNGNRQSGDIVFMTGDFNCDSGTQAMKILKGSLTNDGNDVDVGIDQILVKHTKKLSGGKHDGWPSDHPLVKGSFQVGGNGPISSNPTTPTNPNRNCQDGQRDCGYWASIGECSRNQAYMSKNCKASCGSCSSSSNPTTPTNPTQPTQPTNPNCQDGKRDCGYWASIGECSKNRAFMSVNCKASCGSCPSSTNPSCQDSNGDCSYWASIGECSRNPGYMSGTCKASCKQCR